MCTRYWLKTATCIYATLYYCAWVVFYLLVQKSKIDVTDKKLMFYYPNFFMILFYLMIGNSEERYFIQFKNICLISILCNFAMIILNYHGAIENTYAMMNSFCGLVFATSVIVFISGGRHGIFKSS